MKEIILGDSGQASFNQLEAFRAKTEASRKEFCLEAVTHTPDFPACWVTLQVLDLPAPQSCEPYSFN
jgi:hypothetical protein